jgi:hypothetical protein
VNFPLSQVSHGRTYINADEALRVDCDRDCALRVMDDANFESSTSKRSFRYSGGLCRVGFPAVVKPPTCGNWLRHHLNRPLRVLRIRRPSTNVFRCERNILPKVTQHSTECFGNEIQSLLIVDIAARIHTNALELGRDWRLDLNSATLAEAMTIHPRALSAHSARTAF